MTLTGRWAVMRRNICGCGSTRWRMALTTCSWMWGKRFGSEWWKRSLWTLPPPLVSHAHLCYAGGITQGGCDILFFFFFFFMCAHSSAQPRPEEMGSGGASSSQDDPTTPPYSIIVSLLQCVVSCTQRKLCVFHKVPKSC